MTTRNHTHHAIVIIGTGFGGLSMGHRLKESGIGDFVMLERGETPGGTWRDNDYPGAACDVPARLYSLSFAQRSDWTRRFPTQPELKKYQEDVAKEFGLLPHMRFSHNVLDMRWNETAGHWDIETSQGLYTATYLVSANGLLAEPKTPDIKGVDSFQGKRFHSATWDHDHDLRGKRVAVIGSGASAIQFVPELAKQAGRVDIYQRSPNWIIPRPDRRITAPEKWLLKHVPPYRWLMRTLENIRHEGRVSGIVIQPALMKLFQIFVAERHIRKQIADPALQAKVTPDYVMGCKRILISDDWYPTLCRDHVELITDGIQEIREHSVVDQRGVEREVDVIIFGTGFYATDNPIARHISGRNGQKLVDAWADGEHAYLGMTVPGFPNLFFMTGPNTGTGHTSYIILIEAATRHILQAIRRTLPGQHSIEVREDVERNFNERLQARLAKSVWATGCNSWYQHSSGKITTLWPGFAFSYVLATRKFQPSDYNIGQPTAQPLNSGQLAQEVA